MTPFDLELIRHRLDQLTRPKFEREDVEMLLTEIVRLRAREQRANDKAEEELFRMNELLGTIARAHEQLSLLNDENQQLHRNIAMLRTPRMKAPSDLDKAVGKMVAQEVADVSGVNLHQKKRATCTKCGGLWHTAEDCKVRGLLEDKHPADW